MRKIRFRAWDGKRMHLFDNFHETLSYNDISGWNVAPNEVDYKGEWLCGESQDKTPDFVLMQFTGLLDYDDKEIYEGDIVEYRYRESDIESRVGVVEWYRGEYRIDTHDVLGAIYPEKILGNIYENPELLKEPFKPIEE